jgi:hypothetical protein
LPRFGNKSDKERVTLRLSSYWLWLILLAKLTAPAAPLRAQSLPAPGGKPEKDVDSPTARAQQVVERAEPDIYYIRDESGELVPLLNHSLDEIKKLLELRDGAATAPRPTFRIERLVMRGEAVGDYATLSVELSIITSDAGWVRVPLRFGTLVLTELPKFADDDEHFVDFEADSREYVVWFRGKADGPRSLTLRGLVPLENEGTQTRLRLPAPRAVFSELEFGVPSADATAQVSGGVLENTQQAKERTQFRATGLANDFLLSWQNAAASRTESPTVLSVKGEIVSQIDGGGVDTTATLEVSAFGREFSGFQVRLPRGASLLPVDQPDYSAMEAATPAAVAEDQRQHKVVEVRLKAKTSSKVTVKLVTKQGNDVTRNGTFELGGFEVVGAVRQSGVLAVQVKEDWQVAFVARQGVLQTDDMPPELRGDGLVAGFVYFGQPFSLPVRVSPRQTRTSVEPTYVVQVGPHHLQLDATLRYHIAGAKVHSFSMELGDWQFDPAGLMPISLVNGAAVVFGAGNSVLMPLKQPTTGEVVLKIRARKPILPGVDAIEFGLPRPAADVVASTELVVLPEDNVVLAPRPEAIEGLTGAPPRAHIELPEHHQSPWFYRGDVADPRFAAGFEVAGRRVTARVESQVVVTNGAVKVEQKFFFSVLHEALESVSLVMPKPLAQKGVVEVRYQGKLLSTDSAASEEAGDDQSAAIRVSLPGKQLGEFELTVDYDWSDEALDSLMARATSTRVEVPLVTPGEAECTGQELILVVDPRVHVEPVDKDWTLGELGQSGEGRQTLMFSTSQPRTGLALGFSPAESELNESLLVERVWAQTWLTDSRRLDRTVFRFRSQDRSLRLRVPPGSMSETYRLDEGEPISAAPGGPLDERTLLLPDSDSHGEAHVLEVTFEVPERTGEWGHRSLALAELVGAAAARQVYWQVILPRSEFLLAGPAELANDFVWVWRGIGWSRQPQRDTSELELWSGSHEHENPLPASVNAYLFSGLGPPGVLKITTVSRSALILLSSGFLLAAGLLWIYLPSVRSSSWLFITGIGTLAAAALWPDLALLAVQAAAIGVVLVLLAGVLERRSTGRRLPLVPSGSSSIVRSSTHTHPRAAAPPVPASTQTAALAVELGAEAKS